MTIEPAAGTEGEQISELLFDVACPASPIPSDPVHCLMGGWSEWSVCSKACDGGIQSRSREIVQEPMHNGRPCPDGIEEKDCNTDYCPGGKLTP